MKKIPIFLTFALMIMVLGCGGKGIESSNEADSYSVMTMTTSVQMIRFELQGSGTVTIDWSDGSESVNWEFIDNNWTMFTHEFTDATPRTITITGDNITGLNCIRSGLTSLDVSRNTALTVLFCSYNLLTALDVSQNVSLTILGCSNNEITALDLSQVAALISLDCGYNQLTELDVSRNIALNDELHFSYNQLTADALNALFSTLHSNDFTKKEIHIGGNPGSADCDPSIAEAKGWTVEGFEGLHLDKVEVDQVISMTTRHDALNLHLQGSGRVTIDWGDESTIITLNDGWTEFNHDFIKSSLRTITITSENLTGFECAHNDLITLDVSQNTALTHLGCSENQLTALDISQNTALTHLNCHSNQLTALDLSRNTALTYISAGFNPLTAAALNGLFNSLHSNDYAKKEIHIGGNPGSADCDSSIAEAKGWTVEGFEGLSLDKVEADQVITMTTRHDALNLHLQGSGRVTIDWGDESTIITLNDGWTEFNHDFIKSSLRTITITGENITGLECAHNDLISLDLSRSTALTHLGCSENQLTALDISQNTALAHLNCHSNQLTALDLSRNTVLTYISAGFNPLTAVALNGLFNSLHSNDFEKFIYIIDCPGTADSNKS